MHNKAWWPALLTAAAPLLLSAMVIPGVAHAGEYVTVDEENGVSLYYEESGSGAPVVFVPGWTMTVRYFDHQLEYFRGSESTRFIVFDPRAHGRSSKTLEGAYYARHAQDLKIFIEKLGLRDVVLGGWSNGMTTVYTYLSTYGEDNIRAIVNMDQTPRPLSSGEDSWSEGGADALKGFFDTFVTDRVTTVNAFLPAFYSGPLAEEQKQWMAAETLLTPDIVAALLLYDGWMSDHRATVERTRIPQLYFVAEKNAEAAKRFLSSASPGAQVVVLGRHAMFYDHAPAFNQALTGFLANLP